jgi:hypothetical protein
VIDCPNCGEQVSESDELCPNCGFHVKSRQAGEVRRLRDEGLIHPGRIGAKERVDFAGADPSERGGPRTELPAEDKAREGPEEIDAGL